MGRRLESPTRDLARDIFGGNAGQSLVEVALALPLLLLILIGLADLGRAFYYTTAIASAARQGASARARGQPGCQIGWPLACEELTVNVQPPGPATSNESWMRPRLIGDGDRPFSA